MTLQPGQRIELIEMVREKYPVEPGTRGTVREVCLLNDFTQVWVDWDNGRNLALILPDDRFKVIDSP